METLYKIDGTEVTHYTLIQAKRSSMACIAPGTCSRCGGSGSYSFNLMDGTRCYGCGGSGKVMKKAALYTAEQLPKAQAKAQAKAEKEAQKAADSEKAAAQRLRDMIREHNLTAIFAALRLAEARPQAATHHTQARLQKAIAARNVFERYARQGRDVTSTAEWLRDAWQKYLDLAAKIRSEDELKDEARKDPRQWVRPGRYEITGTVAAVKEHFNSFGISTKAVLKDGVRTYWISIPRNESTEIKGLTATCVATVERSDKDPLFGFASRPSKWVVGMVAAA